MSILALILGCGLPAALAQGERPSLREALGAPQVSTIRQASRVEVFRLHGRFRPESEGKLLMGFPITGTGPEQGREFVRKLGDLILGDDVRESRKRCGFSPGVGYRFWAGNDSLTVIFCFGCDELAFETPAKPNKSAIPVRYDFEMIRPELVRMAKRALPDDAEIQGLERESGEEARGASAASAAGGAENSYR